MKSIIALVIVSLLVCQPAEAQKNRRAPQRPSSSRKPATSAPNANAPRIIGSPVVLVTKNGDEIRGTLVDLTAYSARIRQGGLESTIALDTLASISFGSSAAQGAQPPVNTGMRPEFARDAEAVLSAFQTMADGLRGGTDFIEFGRQLTNLRRDAERFVGKYSLTDSQPEARVLSLVSAALTDYTWARTVWTLKFGRSGDGTVYDTDSPALTDALALYPDLRAASASGNKFSVDKVVQGLWRKAQEKTDRARSIIGPAR